MKELLVLAALITSSPAPVPVPKPAPTQNPVIVRPCLPAGAIEDAGARPFHELPIAGAYKVRTYIVNGKLIVVSINGPVECILDVVNPGPSFEGREG